MDEYILYVLSKQFVTISPCPKWYSHSSLRPECTCLPMHPHITASDGVEINGCPASMEAFGKTRKLSFEKIQ